MTPISFPDPFTSKRVIDLPSLADIKRAPMGRATLDRLIAAGMKPDELETAIQFVVFAQSLRAVRFQDVKGFSRKSLTLFSEELRRTATRIEIIRRNLLYRTTLDFFLPGAHWEQTCNYLRMYGYWLDILIPAFRESAQKNPREGDLRLSRSFWIGWRRWAYESRSNQSVNV